MKFKDKAIAIIKANQALRLELAMEHEKNEKTVLRWLKENKENGPLTTVGSLTLIKKETKLKESEILCD